MNRYARVAGIIAAIAVAGLGYMLKVLSDARIEEGRAATTRSEIYERLVHPQPQHPHPPPDPEAMKKWQAEQDAAHSIAEAWDSYWAGNLSRSLEQFQAERQKNRSSFYRAEYLDGLIASLPAYDSELRGLKKRREASSGPEQDQVNFEIYQLSKKFYDQHGMEAETSMVYGPEFKTAQNELMGKNEEVTSATLLHDWLPEGGSCLMNTPEKPIAALTQYLEQFPSGAHRQKIEELLKEYSSGKLSCNFGKKNEP